MSQPKAPVVVVGMGEMGGVFARGLLRIGHPVYPVTRAMPLASLDEAFPRPERVVVAVAEPDLPAVLEQMPPAWADRLVLLQNELLPRDFAALEAPTVISVWFEKKPGQEPKVIIPSPAYGPGAPLLRDALATLSIPARVLATPDELEFELVLKNLYILTSNLAGLRTGGNVGELWDHHQAFARAVAGDVMDLQEALVGHPCDRDALLRGMVAAFEGDPEHKCMGRSAPARLERALALADDHRLEVTTLRSIADESRSSPAT